MTDGLVRQQRILLLFLTRTVEKHLPADVMLRAVGYLSNTLRNRPLLALLKVSSRRIIPAHISTNTAINESLRRSQHDDETPRRRWSRPNRSPTVGSATTRRATGEMRRMPSFQQGMDVEAMRDSEGINGMPRPQRRLRSELRRNENGEFDRSTLETKYYYDNNLEGHRTFRRAQKFGQTEEPAVFGQSGHATRRTAPPKLSMDHRTSHFPERRPLDRLDRASYINRSREKDHAFEGYRRDQSQDNDDQSSHQSLNVPLSIPYTTPASKFLYGTSAITAALLSSRRKLYRLYIYSGENRGVLQRDNRIEELAMKQGVVVERVKEDRLRLMNKMSHGRPHNGYILEASPLPKLPVIGLHAVERRNGAFRVILDHQSLEDEVVNGTNTNVDYDASFRRYPFVVLLDGILDEGNLGAIMRSALFLGVDMVAMSDRSCAPISPVSIKASAGASETLPLASVSQPGSFIDKCKGNGWKIYAAAAPAPGKRTGLGNFLSSSNLGNPLRRYPSILLLGGEGEGLHWNLRRKADFDVGIDSPRIGRTNVDSLNVSVAAGILCGAFLRKPSEGRESDVNASGNNETHNASSGNDANFQEENRVF